MYMSLYKYVYINGEMQEKFSNDEMLKMAKKRQDKMKK